MCDALALARMISEHNESRDDQFLLNYSTTRRTRAIQVIELAGKSLAILTRIRQSAFIRRWVVGLILNRLRSLKPGIVWRLSGLLPPATSAKQLTSSFLFITQ